MGSNQQQFCLRWNNHQKNMIDMFSGLLSNESFVDVTLACDGAMLKAHKIVLSACSSFFQDIFINNPCKHPVIIMKDMKYKELKSILEFMYCGEVNISQDELSNLLKTAESLKVKGLAEVTNEQQVQQPAEPARAPIGQLPSECTNSGQQANREMQPMSKNNLVRHTSSSSPSSPIPKRPRHRYPDSNIIHPPENADQKNINSIQNFPPDNREYVEAPLPSESNEAVQNQVSQDQGNEIDVKPMRPIQIKQSPNSPEVEEISNSQDYIYSAFGDQSFNENQSTGENIMPSGSNESFRDAREESEDVLSQFEATLDPASISMGNTSDAVASSSSFTGWNISSNSFPFRRYRQWTTEQMQRAVQAVLSNECNINRASVKYGVPQKTLWRYVNNSKNEMNFGNIREEIPPM